jgi:hypothetical protein
MICGPIVPNTLTSLRDVIEQEVGRVERGLRVVATDIVFGHHGEVDVLACDASGAPVLIFAAAPETSAGLATRILSAHTWLLDNAAWLAAEVGESGLRPELGPRVLVIGLEILAGTVAELRVLGVPSLAVMQFSTFTMGGIRRLGVTTLHSEGCAAEEVGSAGCAVDPFEVPNGVVEPASRAVAARFLDTLRKVDARMTSSGDRFSRCLSLGGSLVAELVMTDGRLYVNFPASAELGPDVDLELTEDSCLSLVDIALRMVLLLEVGPDLGLAEAKPGSAKPAFSSQPRIVPSPDRTVVEDDGHSSDVAEPESVFRAASESPLVIEDEERFSLEPIRRSVVQAQLSREEFEALGEG